MSAFCTKCGSPVQAGSAFCVGCGAPAASVPTAAPAAPARSGSPLLKFVLIGFGVLCVLGMLGIAGVIYTGYRVKKSVERYAHKNGIELSDLSSSSSPGRSVDPCSLLTREEAAQVLGVAIIRVTAAGDVCQYFRQPGPAGQPSPGLQQMLAQTNQHPAAKADSTASPREVARQSGVEDLVKNMVGGVNDGSAPYLTVTVHPDGKSQMAAVKLGMAAIGGGQVSESLSGVGDQAYLGPMNSMMWFLKNGVAVEIDLRQVPQGRERGIELARRMLPRL